MRDIEEIKKDRRLRNIEDGADGLKADIHIGGWDGSFIFSYAGGWEHASVSPYAKRITPTWDDMTKIKEMCRQVAENRDVILDVCVLMNGIVEMHLSPLEDEYEDFDEDMYQD